MRASEHFRGWWRPAAAIFLTVTLGLANAGNASAQEPVTTRSTIRDLVLGAPVGGQPADFQEFACGTNGGPPSLPIDSFAEFARCAPEESGLHEVQFRYDDRIHYIALAQRDPLRADLFSGTKIGNYPIIASVLIDDAGIVRGIRAVTDDRVSDRTRRGAFSMAGYVHTLYGVAGWECIDIPPIDGETPVGNDLIKEDCQKVSDDGLFMTTQTRLLRRPGQTLINPANGEIRVGYYESKAWFEIYQADASGGPDYGTAGEALAVAAVETPAPDDPVEAFLGGFTVDCPGCDLSGANLSRRNLAGADLSGADLSGATLHRALLGGATLDGANLVNANLNLIDLKRASLVGADLTGAMLYQADAGAADFSGVAMDGAVAENARFTSATMTGVHWQNGYVLGANLAGVDLTGAVLTGSVFVEADLQRATLVGADVSDGTFYRARLRLADLSEVVAVYTDFLEADLSDAIFANADLTEARLQRARTSGTDLTGAVLTNTVMPNGETNP